MKCQIPSYRKKKKKKKNILSLSSTEFAHSMGKFGRRQTEDIFFFFFFSYKSMGKFGRRQTEDIFFFFFFFTIRWDLTLHAWCVNETTLNSHYHNILREEKFV